MGNSTTNEEVVRRYLETSVAKDFNALASLRHPDWQSLWPQSGERVVGHAHWAEIAQNYPGGVPQVVISRLVGSEDRWVVTPGNTVREPPGPAISGGASGECAIPTERPTSAWPSWSCGTA